MKDTDVVIGNETANLEGLSNSVNQLIETDRKIERAKKNAYESRNKVHAAYATSVKGNPTRALERHGDAIKSIEEVLESTMEIQQESLKFIEQLMRFSEGVLYLSVSNASIRNDIVKKLKNASEDSQISPGLKDQMQSIIQYLHEAEPLYERLDKIEKRLSALEKGET